MSNFFDSFGVTGTGPRSVSGVASVVGVSAADPEKEIGSCVSGSMISKVCFARGVGPRLVFIGVVAGLGCCGSVCIEFCIFIGW